MLFWWSLQTWASTGRLLFPYITSISLLLALGLRAWRIPPLLFAAPLFAFSLAAPFLYIMPNYDHPQPVEQLPAQATAADVQWGDIRLTALRGPAAGKRLARRRPDSAWPSTGALRPSRRWRTRWFSACWMRTARSSTASRPWPGWGTFPHPWMTHHTDYRDDYIMGIPPGAASTPDLQLEIRWYVFPDGPDVGGGAGDGRAAGGAAAAAGEIGWGQRASAAIARRLGIEIGAASGAKTLQSIDDYKFCKRSDC